jgi:hypothetical protein
MAYDNATWVAHEDSMIAFLTRYLCYLRRPLAGSSSRSCLARCRRRRQWPCAGMRAPMVVVRVHSRDVARTGIPPPPWPPSGTQLLRQQSRPALRTGKRTLPPRAGHRCYQHARPALGRLTRSSHSCGQTALWHRESQGLSSLTAEARQKAAALLSDGQSRPRRRSRRPRPQARSANVTCLLR